MKLKKGDRVRVLGGKDKGREGKITKVLAKTAKVLVEGVNIYKKHVKPAGEQRAGGIIEVSRPLPAGKVALICPACSKQTRIGYQLGKEKLRICKKCKGVV